MKRTRQVEPRRKSAGRGRLAAVFSLAAGVCVASAWGVVAWGQGSPSRRSEYVPVVDLAPVDPVTLSSAVAPAAGNSFHIGDGPAAGGPSFHIGDSSPASPQPARLPRVTDEPVAAPARSAPARPAPAASVVKPAAPTAGGEERTHEILNLLGLQKKPTPAAAPAAPATPSTPSLADRVAERLNAQAAEEQEEPTAAPSAQEVGSVLRLSRLPELPEEEAAPQPAAIQPPVTQPAVTQPPVRSTPPAIVMQRPLPAPAPAPAVPDAAAMEDLISRAVEKALTQQRETLTRQQEAILAEQREALVAQRREQELLLTRQREALEAQRAPVHLTQFGQPPVRGGEAAPVPPVAADENFEFIEAQNRPLEVQVRRSLVMRTELDIYRTAVVDPRICDVVQFTPREVSIIGKGEGATHVTFWFRDGGRRPVTYLVKVRPDLEEKRRVAESYLMLEDVVAQLFPNSKVRLTLVADKLIVKGQARDAAEAAQIMAIIRGRMNSSNMTLGSPIEGPAASVLDEGATGRAENQNIQVVNMLTVPGIQQVALRVKIAELNRSAARGFGVDVSDTAIDFGGTSALFLESMLNAAGGNAPALLAQFDGDDINFGIRYLQQHGVVRVLSEPTLVTMSGKPATFIAGGEFAVPTVVGSTGLNAVTTDFRAFGVIISFLPTVTDRDRIRLEVSPEFSQINSDLSVDSIHGLDVRAVTTTVEMREGQTLAIAGLLDESMKASKSGNLPLLSWLFGSRDVTRNETELIILVTPELVHPMEPEEVPPLPGFDVTEPTNGEFFLGNKIEGNPTRAYRSTVWPRLRSRYKAGGPAMISGPFGHGQ